MDWHYAEGDERKGPVDETTLAALIESGAVRRDTLVWRAGMAGWLEAEKVEELRGHFEPDDPEEVRRSEPSPYAAPQSPVEPEPGRLGDALIPRREAVQVVVLTLVTCGIYGLYLLYRWAEEINVLSGTRRYNPVVVLVASILTCGIGAMVFHIIFAFDVEKTTLRSGVPNRLANLGAIVISLLVGGVLLSLVGVPASLATGPVAYWLVQAELNKLAD